jgi:hypothetical protein
MSLDSITITDENGSEPTAYEGLVHSYTADYSSIIVRVSGVDVTELQDKEVLVVVPSPEARFRVRPHPYQRSRWEVVDSDTKDIKAKCYTEEAAKEVAQALGSQHAAA